MARKLREFKTVYKRYSERSTPLLHKDVVESTVCPHQKAVSTFLPPAQRASLRGMSPSGAEAAPEGLRLGEPLARREQRGIISNGVKPILGKGVGFFIRKEVIYRYQKHLRKICLV